MKFAMLAALAAASILSSALACQTPTITGEGEFVCNVPVDAPADIQANWAAWHEQNAIWKQCNLDAGQDWLAAYPETVARWQALYGLMKSSGNLDLRGTAAASTWSGSHIMLGTAPPVSLTAAQVEDGRPVQSGTALEFPGPYNKFFIDQASETMYLTSQVDGLTAIDISARYNFVQKGGAAGGTALDDLYVYNDTYAFAEGRVDGAYGDLLILDISDPSNPVEVGRLEGAIVSPFPWGDSGYYQGTWWDNVGGSHPSQPPSFLSYTALMDGGFTFSGCTAQAPDWQLTSNALGITCDEAGDCTGLRFVDAFIVDAGCVTREQFEAQRDMGFDRGGMGVLTMRAEMDAVAGSASPPGGGTGGAGSLTQMMIAGSTLYVLGTQDGDPTGYLNVFDLSDPAMPTQVAILTLDNMPEALFATRNLLLVAGRQGLMTLSIAEPGKPRIIGEYRDPCPRASDPVRVRGNIAYRTVGEGSCWWGSDSPRLEVFDIQDPVNPSLLASVTLREPMGMTILGDLLYVADRQTGIRVFDIGKAEVPNQTGLLKVSEPKDLIMNHFDLYSLSDYQVSAFYLGPLYEDLLAQSELNARLSLMERFTTIKSAP